MKRNLFIGVAALVLLLISIKFFPYHCNCQPKTAGIATSTDEVRTASSTEVPTGTRTGEISMGPEVVIGSAHIAVDVADTPALREQGLSGRASLKEGTGMLFIFPDPQKPGFWMKDMSFSIDIIWIAVDKRIVGVEKSVSPSSYPKAFYPSEPVKYVLELPAGTFDKEGFRVGDMASMHL